MRFETVGDLTALRGGQSGDGSTGGIEVGRRIGALGKSAKRRSWC